MRVVSLVPSLTEAVALTRPEVLVGATDWCTHPAGLEVTRVGGSKYPDLARVLALRPDLVLLNEEENRRADADALGRGRRAGTGHLPAYRARGADRAGRAAGALGVNSEPDWLVAARPGLVRPARARGAPPGGGAGVAPAVGGARQRHVRR